MVGMLHQTEEELELYSLGCLPELCVEAVEKHLLVCDSCRQELDDIETFALAMRTAIGGEPAETAANTNWFAWLGLPWIRFGGRWRFAPLCAGAFAALVLLSALFLHPGENIAPVASIALTAMRGDMESVAQARETVIVLADAPAGSGIPAEVVDATGGTVWRGLVEGNSHKVRVAKRLTPGNYFVRLYGDTGDLLHEYGFRVL